MYPCYKQVVLVKKIVIALIKLNVKKEFEVYNTHIITSPTEISNNQTSIQFKQS